MGPEVADPDDLLERIFFILQKTAGKMDLAVGKIGQETVSGDTFELPLETPCGKGTFFCQFRDIVIVPGGTLHLRNDAVNGKTGFRIRVLPGNFRKKGIDTNTKIP